MPYPEVRIATHFRSAERDQEGRGERKRKREGEGDGGREKG
jgi:hypothetical protein